MSQQATNVHLFFVDASGDIATLDVLKKLQEFVCCIRLDIGCFFVHQFNIEICIL